MTSICILCGKPTTAEGWVTIAATAEFNRPEGAPSFEFREWHVHRECLLKAKAVR